MSSSLADELLKTKKISELRTRCQSLSVESLDKQTELQRMVGSQYREFIQSADKISKMYAQTKEIDSNLAIVFQENEKVCNHLSLLLHNKGGILNLNSSSSSSSSSSLSSSIATSSLSTINFYKLFEDLRVNNIWRDLTTCSFFLATEKLLLSQIFSLDYVSKKFHKFNFLTSNCYEIINYYNNNKQKNNLFHYYFNNINQLYDTIQLDCQTFLFYQDNESPGLVSERAQSLACYSLLSLFSDNEINKKNVYDIYLDSIELRLEEINEDKLKNGESGMVELVYLLQVTVMELYLLFFMPLSVPSDLKGIDEDDDEDDIDTEKKNTSQKMNFQFTGLIHFYEFYMIINLNQRISANTTLSLLDMKTLYNDHKSSREVLIYKEKAITFLPKKLIEVQEWLQNKLKISTERSSKVLLTLKNALQVASLQQRIYQNCVNLNHFTVNFSFKLLSKQLNYEGINSLWVNACRLFFTQSPSETRSILSGEGLLSVKQIKFSDSYRLHLWSTVFRISFLRQVERLLEFSCEEILLNVSSLLVESMRSLGLVIECENHILSHANINIIIHPTLGLKNSTSIPIGTFINSSQIFLASEKIRGFFEQSLSKLVQNVIFPIRESEKKFNELQDCNSTETLSSNALLHTLKIYTSKLVGQLISLLRRITDSLTSLLFNSQINHLYLFTNLQSSSIFPESLKSIISSKYSLYLTRASQQQFSQISAPSSNSLLPNLHSALILIGRLSWGLKCHCDATSNALDPFRDILESESDSSSTVNNFNNIISEEQFLSAFEIADADGDGIIINEEVAEALQALLLTESSTENIYPQCGFSLKSAVSLTFDEFILIYGSENLPQKELIPLSRFHHSLDQLITLSHLPCFISWISSASNELYKSIENIFFNYSDNGLNINHFSLLKQSWSYAFIDNEGELKLPKNLQEYSESGFEKIYYPSRSSSPLLQYYLNLSSIFNRYLLSLDTLTDFEFNKSNSLALSFRSKENQDDGIQEFLFSNLLFFYSNKVEEANVFNLSKGFQQLFIDFSLLEIHSIYSKFIEKSNEVISLQIYFDLQLSSQLTSRWFSQTYSLNPAIVSLSSKYICQIDPIIEELLRSTIDLSVKGFYSQHHLLLFSLPNFFNEEKKKEEEIPSISSVSSHFAFTTSPSIPKCSLLPFAFNLSSSFSTVETNVNSPINNVSPPSASTSTTPTSLSTIASYESKLKQRMNEVVGNINEKTKKGLYGFNLWS